MPIQIQTFVNYSVAFVDGKIAMDLAEYYSDLVVSMDQLSDFVTAQIWGQRRLQEGILVRAMKPTRIVQEMTVGELLVILLYCRV